MVGNFEVGKQFDALKICTTVVNSPCDIFEKDTVLDTIQKFFYLGKNCEKKK